MTSGAGETADRRHMRRALELAERGLGRVAPNPLVGAVVVRDGRVVGEGWHEGYGAPHAEVRALEAAGEAARGATVYVGLEPCDHRGKTPPCTEAILRAGVERVVVGCPDPHPEARGGAKALRRQGLRVDVGVEGRAAARLNAPFLWRQRGGRPFVTLKLALSLDARIAAREGERTAVTGDAAWRHVHRLRAAHDAVLVGRRTAEVDDPRLTARGDIEPREPAVRVVMDSGLALSPTSRLARTTEETPTWVACTAPAPAAAAALEEAGVRVLELPAGTGGGVDPTALLERLGGEGIGSVLVEGGGRVAASFLREEAVERMHLLYAPVLFGSDGVEGFPGGRPATGEGWRVAARDALGRDTLLELESPALADLLDRAARPEAFGSRVVGDPTAG